MIGPEDGRTAARGLLTALSLALTLPLVLWHTRAHLVPTSTGHWRGLSDPPEAARVVLAALAGLVLTWALKRRSPASLRPLLWLALAGAPLVTVASGKLPVLLAFQGPALVVVACAALAAALQRSVSSRGPHLRMPGPVLFATAFGLYALLGLRIPGPAGPQGDEPHYLAMAHSLLTDGDLDLTDEFARREYAAFFAGELQPHTSPASPPGRLYPVHTPGLPVLLLPAYALGGYAGTLLLMSVLAALLTVVVHGLVRDTARSDGLALAVWSVIAFTPPLPFYAMALYPEVPAALATAVFLRAAWRAPGTAEFALGTLLAAGLPWLHPKFLPLALVGMALMSVRLRSANARAIGCGVLATSVALLLAFFAVVYGRVALSAAYGPGFASDVSLARAPRGLLALLLDRQFGLLSISPVWALALFGGVSLVRRHPVQGLGAALLAAATIVVGASFSMWWGGACPPARFVVPALPVLALALAPAAMARPGAAAALSGAGIAIVALAADAPRALHNRPDAESALLRVLAPTLDLDGLLPSFVPEGVSSSAVLLAVSLLAALALAWARGARGLVAGAAGYGVLAAALHLRPLIDPQRATLQLLADWEPARLRGPSGPPDLRALSIPLELPASPWILQSMDVRNSRRLDLPPGLYRVEVGGRTLDGLPTAHVVRLDLAAGELLLARGYLRVGQPAPSLALMLPAGARRMGLTASGIQGRGIVDSARLVPEALVQRGERGALAWPRLPEPERYRVGSGAVRVTVLDRSAPEADGFRLEGSTGSFLVEGPDGGTVWCRIGRPQPSATDVVVWGDRRQSLGSLVESAIKLPLDAGLLLGSTRIVKVEVDAQQAWASFSDPPTPRP